MAAKVGLKLKPKKCGKEVLYLGPMVSHERVARDHTISIVSRWPMPTAIKEVQKFLVGFLWEGEIKTYINDFLCLSQLFSNSIFAPPIRSRLIRFR